MEIQKTRIFRIPGQRIVKDYVCEHLGLTDADYDKIEPKVFWDVNCPHTKKMCGLLAQRIS